MRLLIAVLLIAGSSASSSAQQTTADELRNTTEALYRAAIAARSTTSPASLITNASWLRDSVRRPVSWEGPTTRASDVSRAYLDSLQAAAELLKRGVPARVQLAIAEDLQAKVDHCRELNIGMGGAITLTVNTRRGDGAVRNLQVKYLLSFYDAVEGAQPGTFPRLSSPTEAALAPGLYWIWATDPSTGRNSGRTLVRAAGQRRLVVDVPVP